MMMILMTGAGRLAHVPSAMCSRPVADDAVRCRYAVAYNDAVVCWNNRRRFYDLATRGGIAFVSKHLRLTRSVYLALVIVKEFRTHQQANFLTFPSRPASEVCVWVCVYASTLFECAACRCRHCVDCYLHSVSVC